MLYYRLYRRYIEKRLEVAVSGLERTFWFHELAACLCSTKEAELSLKVALKGLQYAMHTGNKTWIINNAFLIARANYLQGDLEDAKEVLADAVNCAIRLKRIKCKTFLEKVHEL